MAGVLAQFKTGVREILLDRRVFLTSNMEGVQNLSLGALEAFLPIYAVQMAHLSALQAGLLWGVQMVATIASKPIMGRFSDRYGRQPLLFWGMWVCALPFALIPWFQDFTVLMALAAVFGLGEAVVTSSAAALVADYCRQEHLGSAMGTFGTSSTSATPPAHSWPGSDRSLGRPGLPGPFCHHCGPLIIAALIFKGFMGGAEVGGSMLWRMRFAFPPYGALGKTA